MHTKNTAGDSTRMASAASESFRAAAMGSAAKNITADAVAPKEKNRHAATRNWRRT